MVIKKVFIVVIIFSFTLLSIVTSGIALADLNDGLVAYYPFNGNADDESGNGNDGTVYGATLTADRFGNANRAYNFDGLDDYIEKTTPSDILNIRSQSWAISAWIMTSNKSGQIIVSRYECGWDCDPNVGAEAVCNLSIRTDGSACFGLRSDTSDGSLISACSDTRNVADGLWHHIVGVLDREAMLVRIFVDGEQINTSAAEGLDTITDAGSPLEIGRYFRQVWDTPALYFEGVLDDIRIYNRVLSEDDIQKLFSITSIPIDLPEGWSMISLPVDPLNKKLEAVFPDAAVVYRYEKGAGYVRVDPDEDLEVGKGYWILLDEDRTYTLTGVPIESYTIPIDADGWLMIGGCTDLARVIPQGCDIGVIYGYVQGSGYQQVTGHLERGRGYWLLLNNVDAGATISVETVD